MRQTRGQRRIGSYYVIILIYWRVERFNFGRWSQRIAVDQHRKQRVGEVGALWQQVSPHRLWLLGNELILFPHKNPLFPHSRFSTHFFSMKMAELGKNVLVSCIIDFDDIQLCKVMTVFLIFLGRNLKKIVITLQILRFQLPM